MISNQGAECMEYAHDATIKIIDTFGKDKIKSIWASCRESKRTQSLKMVVVLYSNDSEEAQETSIALWELGIRQEIEPFPVSVEVLTQDQLTLEYLEKEKMICLT